MIRFLSSLTILFLITFSSCQTKGPVTFDNYLVGKTKGELIELKGKPTKIKNFGSEIAYIYVVKEEFYGKSKNTTKTNPKATYNIEYIYYINNKSTIYKYQVWKKKLKK